MEALRARFEASEPFTVGIEEEALPIDETSGRSAPVAIDADVTEEAVVVVRGVEPGQPCPSPRNRR